MTEQDAVGLGKLRRYTWLTLVASVVLTLIGVLGWRQFRPETPTWSGAVGLAALAVACIACTVAFHRRLSSERNVSDVPVAWLAAGSVASVVLAALILAID